MLLNELQALNDSVDVLVIDLRYNPGGDEPEFLRSLNMFLDRPTNIIFKKSHYDAKEELIKSDNLQFEIETEIYNKIFTKPVVILINGESASASELLTASLRDLGRAIVVGDSSFGKGIGQIPISIDFSLYSSNLESLSESDRERRIEFMKNYTLDSKDAMLRVSVFQLFRLSGKNIQNQGITPDIEIPMVNYENTKREKDDDIMTLDDETVTPADSSLYDHYNMVDDYLDSLKSKFELRKNNDSNIKELNNLVSFDQKSGKYSYDEKDMKIIDETILQVAVSIASDYVDTINEKK